MKRTIALTLLSALLMISCTLIISRTMLQGDETRAIKVGFVHVDDAASAYTENFIAAADVLKHKYGEQVEVINRYNVALGSETDAFEELAAEGCELIFSTSHGYSDSAKSFAEAHPDIEVCQATGSNANDEPVLSNYHTFMGKIYEGRYAAGVVAGLKLRQLIDSGELDAADAKVGYVAAYSNAEVISGYTAFLLGVRSAAPEATMDVICTGTWSNYALEKNATKKLIERGCVIISQHTDTYGPAAACEEAALNSTAPIYIVGYNRSMGDTAPSTALTSCRISWAPYITGAVEAVIKGLRIESVVSGTVYGSNDMSAGFSEGWVEMLDLNESLAAPDTAKEVADVIEKFKKGKLKVFEGDYTATDPLNASDTYDLSAGYTENATASAPSFHYVLDDIITIVEND